MDYRSKQEDSAEKQLVGLLHKKDKAVISLLYERYAQALYGVVSALIPDEPTAREALQDAFLKIWQNGDKYDAFKGRLFTWMVQITRNVAIDTLRSSQFKKGTKTEPIPSFVSNYAPHSEEQKEKDPALRKIVAQLDVTNRKIIELLYFEDYTQKEVSEALDIPLGTVKSKVRKAMLQLRELLGDEKFFMLSSVKLVDILIQQLGH